MNDKPALRPEIPVADGLRAIARDALKEARQAIEDPDKPEAAAVHDFRKAMKRWRALLRLLAPYLGDGGALRKDAREAAHQLTGARDQQAAIEALDDLARQEGKSLTSRSQETIRNRLETARRAAEIEALTPAMRERLRTSLGVAADAVERWPLDDVTFQDVAGRLQATYRRARRFIPDDWMNADAEHLHELRKRVVEHRYQIEIVEPLWPRLGRVWTDEAQRLRERLGRCQDLEVLRRTTEPHQPLAPWRSRLGPLLAARRATQVATASRLAARLFAEEPKAFRRRLVALWQNSRHTARNPGPRESFPTP